MLSIHSIVILLYAVEVICWFSSNIFLLRFLTIDCLLPTSIIFSVTDQRTNNCTSIMHYLIRCVGISESVSQGFHKLLFVSSKSKTVYTQPVGRTCHSFAFTNEKKFSRKDRVPPDYQLIYQLERRKTWTFAALAAYAMILISPVLIYPYISPRRRYYKPVDMEGILENAYTTVYHPKPNETEAFTCGAIVFNLLVYIFIRKYPLRIYFNGEKYIAIYPNVFFPLVTKKHYFEKARRTKSLLVFLPDSNYRLGNRNGRLLIPNFRRPIDFEKMLVTPYYEEEEES